MCGIHGLLAVKFTKSADKFISDGFVAGSLRGRDASGIAQVQLKKNTYDVQKLPICGPFFITEKRAANIIWRADSADTLSICHTRHATAGGISTATSHPFVCEGEDRVMLGVHNGTLTGWNSRADAKGYDVDSEWALNHIMKEGYDAFEDFNGSFCFAWWDSDTPKVLNIARNSERPMHIIMLKEGGMAFASEAGMLHWLLERNEVATEGSVLELAENHWYKFPVDDPRSFTKTTLPAPKTSGWYPLPNHGPRETMMDRVKKLFVTTPESNVSVLPINKTKSPKVSQVEYEAADKMGLLGLKVEFQPWNQWEDGVEGMAMAKDADMFATSVCDFDTVIDYTELWSCFVIGVDDDGKEVSLILGPPISKHKHPESQVAVIH